MLEKLKRIMAGKRECYVCGIRTKTKEQPIQYRGPGGWLREILVDICETCPPPRTHIAPNERIGLGKGAFRFRP